MCMLTQAFQPMELQFIFKSYAKHLFEALECLFNQSIVHGDIKPQNTVFWKSSDNKSLNFKLLDFGLARIVSRNMPVPRVAQQSGTIYFRAPEIAAQYGAIHSCMYTSFVKSSSHRVYSIFINCYYIYIFRYFI